MFRTRPLISIAGAVCTATILAAIALPAGSAGASATPTPSTRPVPLPQSMAARKGAEWLALQFTSPGFIPTAPGSSTADLSATAQSVLALSAANVDLGMAQSGLAYLASHQATYVTDEGAIGPGQVALLILDAVALGADPRDFGGVNLVTELLSTQQTTGSGAGLFGTAAQVTGYAAGTYQQGLALAALAAAGVRGGSAVSSGVTWLIGEQCPGGGWTTPDLAVNTCSGIPSNYSGPDTNSTSLAVEGLAAQGALSQPIATKALTFLTTGQDPDGGWGYYPNTSATPGTTDPDSTSLVIQGLLALGVSPSSAAFVRGSSDPVSALMAFQLTSGSGAGGFYYPPAPAPADLLATYQAVPALEGLAFPFGPSGRAYGLTSANGGIYAFGDAGYMGSLPGLGVSVDDVVGMASTPDGGGYWLVSRTGGIYAFGDAGYMGSLPGLGVSVDDVVGMAGIPERSVS